jgi:predicted DNA-binding protein (MmcQ/YjbR family)
VHRRNHGATPSDGNVAQLGALDRTIGLPKGASPAQRVLASGSTIRLRGRTSESRWSWNDRVVFRGASTYARSMAHPKMFSDEDPYLARVRTLAAELPESAEKVSHGRPAFYTRRVFAYYGGSHRDDGAWVEHGHSLVVLPDPEDRRALLDDERTYVPAYLGPSGWVGLDLDEGTDWAEVAELLDASYRMTAPKRAIDQLDARRDAP